jgi:methyl-CpG-binding domain protein 4
MSEQPTNLSDYELQRLAHIRRNHEFLVGLGLADANVDPVEAMRTGHKKPSKPRGPREKKIAPPPESLRRSPRIKGEQAEFGAEIVNAFGDEEDRPSKRARPADDVENAALAEMRGEAMAYLREVREAQLVLSVPEGGKGDDWRREAVRRWGALAGAGKEDRDWKLFVESRLSTPPPVSPIEFLQE